MQSSATLEPRPTPSLTVELIRLAAPLLLTNLSGVMIGATDTLFMGRISTSAVAAVGLGSVLFWTLFLLPRGTINAVIPFVAQAFGAREVEKVKRWLVCFLMLALVCAPLALVYAPLVPLLLSWSGAELEVQRQATAYIHVRLFELPFGLLSTALLGFLIGRGDSKTPMFVTWTVVLLNGVLNWVFVFGNLGAPRLEIVGAALGSAISVASGALIAGVIVLGRVARDLKWSLPNRLEWREMLRVGAPLGVMECVEVSAFTAFMALTGRISTDALASSQIANQISGFAFMPGFALGTATASLVGRFIGARALETAMRAGYVGTWLGMAWMGMIGVIFWVGAEGLARAFSDDDAVIRSTVALLRLMTFYQLFDAINIVFRSALAGAGDTRFTAFVTILLAWGVMVGGGAFLVIQLKTGVLEAWLAPFAYLTLLAGIYWWRWRGGSWQRLRIG
jgi:multidrug resistance protein, MATE family